MQVDDLVALPGKLADEASQIPSNAQKLAQEKADSVKSAADEKMGGFQDAINKLTGGGK